MIVIIPVACDGQSGPVSTPGPVKKGQRMSQLPFLHEYAGQTAGQLLALEGKYRIDSLVLAFENALGRKVERVGLEGLTGVEVTVLTIESFEREINNGGFDQFFLNPSKVYAPYLVGALARVGCVKVGQIAQKAIDALGINGDLTVEAIDGVMEEDSDIRDEALHGLDYEYYAMSVDLSGPLFEYIKSNIESVSLVQ